MDRRDWDRVLDTNLWGVMNCMKRAAGGAIRSGGSIVNVTNMTAQRGHAGLSAYSAAAHGVLGITRCAAIELALVNIRVNAVCA